MSSEACARAIQDSLKFWRLALPRMIRQIFELHSALKCGLKVAVRNTTLRDLGSKTDLVK